MKKLLFIATITLMMSGCTKEPISSIQTNNKEFVVEFLFEQDGIKVYRFVDNGRTHYFTKNVCTTIQDCGKNCTYEERIESK